MVHKSRPPCSPSAARRGPPSCTLLALAGVAMMTGGCATGPRPTSIPPREVVVAYDDSRTTGTVAFPSTTYESVTRFDLPEGEHRPLRLRLQAETAGTLEITIYENTVLETPGGAIHTVARQLDTQDLSNGRDGRWVVEDLAALKSLKGTVWVGVKKSAGEPTLWSSSVASGQCYVRNNDPQNLMELLPIKRTPMIRLELAAVAP